MPKRHVILRALIVVPVILTATVYVATREPVRGIDLHSRLVSSEALPREMAEACTWDTAAPDRAELQRRGGGAAGPGPAMGDPRIAARMPVSTIRDPYAGFAAVRVDPVHNEVVVMDEFKFNIYVYDRLAVTPASAMQTTPKRFIGGGKTLSRYNSDGYVDTRTGDIYIVNNDSEPGMFKFTRTAEGNVDPASELLTPYGAFGMTVDEERGEVFLTIQHDGAIQIFKKGATGEDNAIRLIQGNKTHLADPHGIAFDPNTRLLYVANRARLRQGRRHDQEAAHDDDRRREYAGHCRRHESRSNRRRQCREHGQHRVGRRRQSPGRVEGHGTNDCGDKGGAGPGDRREG